MLGNHPQTLQFSATAKTIRAKVIAQYMATAYRNAGVKPVVCFTCGNSADALREQGLVVLEASNRSGAAIKPDRWWTPDEIATAFPMCFDGTSGHLPGFLMVRIAKAFREHLGVLPYGPWRVPTGSGETLICLTIAYPENDFIAVYDNKYSATEYNPSAPLNEWVKAVAYDISYGL